MTRGGQEAWSGEKPYSLWEAEVTDDGLVAGYAYSHGWEGVSKAGYKAWMGEFRVVILDPQGKERLDHVTKREQSNFIHMAPNPLAAGLIVDAANDRMIVRVRDADVNRGAESWWGYRLSTGKPISTFRPKELMGKADQTSWILSAKPVAGTPLILVHWRRFNAMPGGTDGARFTLIDEEGKTGWVLDLADDYEAGGNEEAQEKVIASVERTGGIFEVGQFRRFTLRCVKDAARVTFSVSREESGKLSVTEVERRPFIEAAPPVSKLAEVPLLRLRPAGRIVLASPSTGPRSEIDGVFEFRFDPNGLIGFVSRPAVQKPAFMVVDQQGKILHTILLEPATVEGRIGWSELTCVGPGRFLLLHDSPITRNTMDGALVDVATGKVAPMPGFSTTPLSKVAGFPDGGFVVQGGLADSGRSATGDHNLRGYNSQGKQLWTLPGMGDSTDPAALFSPDDITVTTDGRISVVDVGREMVQFFDRAGKHLRTIDLKKAWERDPRYPSELSADRDGGVVVQDFQGDPPIVRMDADGTVRAQVKPRFKDGQAIDLRDVQVAPDGAIWVSDSHALYRLAESGVVDRVIGEAPNPRRLSKPDAVALDARGRIYAADSRTGAVHVFEPDGRWLRVCIPEPGDVTNELSLSALTVADSGDIYLAIDPHGTSRYLHFSPEGKRVGVEPAKLDDVSQTWHAQRGTTRRWVIGYETIYLMDSSGAVVRTIDRLADGSWLDRPGSASVAADGSLAVVSNGKDRFGKGPHVVGIYSPSGEPIRTFALPPGLDWSFPRIAYDGRRVVVVEDKEFVLCEATGKFVGRVALPQDPQAFWSPLLDPKSHNLLLFDGVATLHRFEMP